MHVKHFFPLLGFTLFCALSAYAYEFQPLGFESIGMGGAGVASARGPMAAYYNPALLTQSPYPFELNISAGVGIQENNLAENADTLSKIDLNSLVNSVSSSLTLGSVPNLTPQQQSELAQGQVALQSLKSGNSLTIMPGGSVGMQMGSVAIGVFLTSDTAAVANISGTQLLFQNTESVAGQGNMTVYLNYNPQNNAYSYNALNGSGGSVNLGANAPAGWNYDPTLTAAYYQANSIQNGLNTEKTNIQINSLSLAEIPVSSARKFNLPIGTLSVGASVKLMQGYGYTNSIDVDTQSSDITKNIQSNVVDSSAFGVDAGLLFQPACLHNLSIGLVDKDINSPKFQTTGGGNYTVNPMLRAGLDYSVWHRRIDFALDCDLTKNASVDGLESDSTQFLGGGINFHPTSWLSLRAGAMQNMADASEDGTIATAGVGFGMKWIQFDVSGEMASKQGDYNNQQIPRYAQVNVALVSRW